MGSAWKVAVHAEAGAALNNLSVARFGLIDRSNENQWDSAADRSAQDRPMAKLDEVVQTPVPRLSGRAASRATNAYAVRAAEIVLTHRFIWKFAD
jgi:hypothetical protein